jgi:hypothetical protein
MISTQICWVAVRTERSINLHELNIARQDLSTYMIRLVDDHRLKAASLLFKLDISKAFGSVPWPILLEVLRHLSSVHIWRDIISGVGDQIPEATGQWTNKN